MSTARVRIALRPALLALLAALAAGAAPREAAAQLGCGETVGPGSATLTGNVGPCDGAAAAFIVDGATLDLGGFTITCADTNGDGEVPDGVVLLGKKATVRNGTIVGCEDGIVLGGSGKHRVEAVTSRNSTEDGIIAVAEASKNRLLGNVTSANADDGMEINSDKNKIADNVADGNGEDGIDVVFADKNKITGNTVSNNADDGFDVGGDKNKLTGNTALTNAEDGIDVRGTKNRTQKNTSMGNGAFDIRGSEPCTANRWKKNTFGTRSGSCIQ